MWFVFELVIWPQEVTLARWTQPSGPLCLWQCLLTGWKYNFLHDGWRRGFSDKMTKHWWYQYSMRSRNRYCRKKQKYHIEFWTVRKGTPGLGYITLWHPGAIQPSSLSTFQHFKSLFFFKFRLNNSFCERMNPADCLIFLVQGNWASYWNFSIFKESFSFPIKP